MQATGPVDSDIALVAVEPGSALHAAASANTTELEQAVEHGAVVAHIVFALLSHEAVHVVWGDLLQELDVLVRMELRHLGSNGGFGALLCCGRLAAIRIATCNWCAQWRTGKAHVGRQVLT